MIFDLDQGDVENLKRCIVLAWKNGEVNSEAEGAALSALRAKLEKPLPPPSIPEGKP